MEEVIISDSLVNNYSLYAIITIFTVGIILGMYISSQIKESIRSNINRKELLKNIKNEQKKRKN